MPTAQALLHSGRLKCEGLLGPVVRLEEAAHLFTQMVLSDTLEEFLTLPAYELIS